MISPNRAVGAKFTDCYAATANGCSCRCSNAGSARCVVIVDIEEAAFRAEAGNRGYDAELFGAGRHVDADIGVADGEGTSPRQARARWRRRASFAKRVLQRFLDLVVLAEIDVMAD